jgi:two-component system, OmpR family, response regulator
MAKPIYRVLLVEPDRSAADAFAQTLRDAHHLVEHVENGSDGLLFAASERFDILICAKSLAGEIGSLELIRALRSQENPIAIMVLADDSPLADRIEGLRAGCDDYQSTRLPMSELVARVEALGRRDTSGDTVTKLEIEDLELDLLTQDVRRAGMPLNLSSREYRILRCLMEHQGSITTRKMLLEEVWHFSQHTQTNVIEMNVCCLRRKVDKPFKRKLIQTVRGKGYIVQALDWNTLRNAAAARSG